MLAYSKEQQIPHVVLHYHKSYHIIIILQVSICTWLPCGQNLTSAFIKWTCNHVDQDHDLDPHAMAK